MQAAPNRKTIFTTEAEFSVCFIYMNWPNILLHFEFPNLFNAINFQASLFNTVSGELERRLGGMSACCTSIRA